LGRLDSLRSPGSIFREEVRSAINFYRQISNGSLTDSLDEARKKSETLLFSSGKRTPSSIARCIFDDGFRPRKADALELAAAAAFLFCGSPVQIHNKAMHHLMLHQMELFNRMGTKEAEDLYRERHGDKASEKLAEDRQQILDGDLFADVGRENWKQLGFESFRLEESVIKMLLGDEDDRSNFSSAVVLRDKRQSCHPYVSVQAR